MQEGEWAGISGSAFLTDVPCHWLLQGVWEDCPEDGALDLGLKN